MLATVTLTNASTTATLAEDDPHATGKWLVLIDKNGEDVWMPIYLCSDGSYTTTVTLYYDVYGEFYWNSQLSAVDNERMRPEVPFYFVVDGQVLGAPEANTPTMYDYKNKRNPLYETENWYTIAVGYSNVLGIYPGSGEDDQSYYVYCAQGPIFPSTIEDVTPYFGCWLVLLDRRGNEVWRMLYENADGSLTTSIALSYSIFGDFYWNPLISDEKNELNRPAVAYYYVIYGDVYGADEAMKATVIGDGDAMLNNPLVEEGTDYYTVPVGYYYTMGVSAVDGEGRSYAFCQPLRAINTPVWYGESLRGDADGDAEVNIADVVLVIDYILRPQDTSINRDNADCDSDGEITIADVVMIIDYILNKTW